MRNEDVPRRGPRRADSRGRGRRTVFNFFSSTPVDVVGERFGFEGPRQCVVAACSSSTIAIGHARGRDSSAGDRRRARRRRRRAVPPDVQRLQRAAAGGSRSRAGRSTRRAAGMTIGEAAAMLVLEDLEHAHAARRAHLRRAGWARRARARRSIRRRPSRTAVALAATIRAALEAARIPADAIDHVNAHGTGTPHNDRAEARAFHRVFGDRARDDPGQLDQVDGRALPRRGGRDRGGDARAHDLARDHPADDQPPRDRPRVRPRRRAQRRARSHDHVRTCRRRSPSAATTPRSS